MRHEDATAAIETVRQWFGGEQSKGEDVNAKVARLINAILEADQVSAWLHDNGDWRGSDSQKESVELLRAVANACDIDAIRRAISEAHEYENAVRKAKDKMWE